jgi:hypothetical protein
MAIPGRNMATESAWKYFRRAFRLRVGTCLSAASSSSVAAWLTPEPFGSAASVGIGGNDKPMPGLDDGGVFAVLTSVDGAVSPLDRTFDSLLAVAGRGRYRRERASWRFHAATLTLPSAAQYASSAGRVHGCSPPMRKNSAHVHGSRPPSAQRVQRPTMRPTTSAEPP